MIKIIKFFIAIIVFIAIAGILSGIFFVATDKEHKAKNDINIGVRNTEKEISEQIMLAFFETKKEIKSEEVSKFSSLNKELKNEDFNNKELLNKYLLEWKEYLNYQISMQDDNKRRQKVIKILKRKLENSNISKAKIDELVKYIDENKDELYNQPWHKENLENYRKYEIQVTKKYIEIIKLYLREDVKVKIIDDIPIITEQKYQKQLIKLWIELEAIVEKIEELESKTKQEINTKTNNELPSEFLDKIFN